MPDKPSVAAHAGCGHCATLLLLTALASTAHADDIPLTNQSFQFSLGSFINNSKLEVRADGSTARGTTVDWGETFGDQDVTRFRLDGYWRIAQHHHVRFMYTDYSRSTVRTLSEAIIWNDQTYPVNATVTAKQGFTIGELAYEYDFSDSPDRDLVLSIGLHETKFTAGIAASVDTSLGNVNAARDSEANVNAPLPVIGARGMWLLGHDLYVDAQVQYFALSIDKYDGSIVNYRAALVWQPISWVGVGLGYDSFGINIDVDNQRFRGSMEWTYSGPQIFLNLAF